MTETSPRYLYTGWLPEFGTCETRRRGLLELGREVLTISYRPFFGHFGEKFDAVQTLLGTGPSILAYNAHLVKEARRWRPDVVWIDKGQYVSATTLKRIKSETGAFIVCYNTDDINHARNGWRLHLPAVPHYDLYFTTNRYNVPELGDLGAPRVRLTQMGYDRDLFDWCPPPDQEERSRLGAEVGFIGHWEPATEELFKQVAASGLPLRVRGPSWNKLRDRQTLGRYVEAVAVRMTEYVKALASTRVNLGVNAAQSRNLCSGRTFEIPAAGGFLLAERTIEHQELYREGHEAEFFGSTAELIDKAGYYLAHEPERRAVAEAGRARVRSGGWTWQARAAAVAAEIEREAQLSQGNAIAGLALTGTS